MLWAIWPQGCFLSMDVLTGPNIKDLLTWTKCLSGCLDRTKSLFHTPPHNDDVYGWFKKFWPLIIFRIPFMWPWKPFLGSIHPQGTLRFPSFPESIQSVDYPWLYFAPFSFSCLHCLHSLKKKTAKVHQKYLNNQLTNIEWLFTTCKDLLFN